MTSNALELYCELHSLQIDIKIKENQLIATKPIPDDLLIQIKTCKEEFFRIVKEINDDDPGVCKKCSQHVADRFLGGYCLECVDKLLGICERKSSI